MMQKKNTVIQNRSVKDASTCGIILLDKPCGISSNGALQKVKRLLKVKKAGHSGSLDPMATGMLPIFINQATKFSQYMLDSDKTYLATIQLGITTDTGDKEGNVLQKRPVPQLDDIIIEAFLSHFRGQIEQIPPMYSALKIDGKPLYKLARSGVEVERKARKVTVYDLINQGYDTLSCKLKVLTKVSKGTYIRSLAYDIGESIGCGAHLTQLRRISCGGFNQAHKMITLEKLSEQLAKPEAEKSATIIETGELFINWPVYQISDVEIGELKRSGRWLGENAQLTGWYVFKLDQKFIGIGQFEQGQLKSRKLLID
ncbi:tRNA pseudouridine(55) synthase TruB [Thiotrichales bacterium 19S3-7]|nr:tRNA pseudouridine(55) synthase TruB [Thiotrichales bacterium 19S3-7]MCF6801547.1 tRNA pseudouridine(55) synthase TruB [Thiotrichales bacterium 19S3-11]